MLANILNNKKLMRLFLSAVLAFLFVNLYLKDAKENQERPFSKVAVLTALREIPPHTLIKPSYLVTREIPVKFIEPGAVMVKIPEQANQVLNKVSIAAIPAGAQITQWMLQTPSAKQTGLAPMIPKGKRAYVLRLGNLDIAPLINPGDRIDIMATFSLRGKENSVQRVTKTILQNIEVLAVDKEVLKPGDDVTAKEQVAEGRMLSLSLSPEETERLSLAQIESSGEITIAVRKHGDDEILVLPGVIPEQLLLGPGVKMAPPPTSKNASQPAPKQ